MLVLRAEAGSRPACESLSFASPKERNQRKGDPTVCVPAAARRGNLRCSGLAGSRSTRAAARRSDTREPWSAKPCAPRRIHRGKGSRTSTRAFASLGLSRGRKRHALRRRGRAQQWPEWMSGCLDVRLSHPLLAASAAGRLGGGTRVAARVLRAQTRRGCLNEAATQRSEFHGAPRNRTDAGLPLRNAKGSQTGGRLFFGDFLLAKQKKVTRSPGDSRPPPSTEACGSISARRKTLQNQ